MTIETSYTQISHQPMLKPMALPALWRHRAAKELRRWGRWLSDEALLNDTAKAHLSKAQELLNKPHYTIAIVSEVSRGKSELINAMLFAQHGQRIAPSGAGRTTMCPTEFYCDEDAKECIELLPIETRLGSESLNQLCSTPSAWQRFEWGVGDTAGLADALLKVCATKTVSNDAAQALGLSEEAFIQTQALAKDAIEIPQWRYARVNLHHPLLASGLAILDTPGLNALGHETELTHAILPMVDAVIYMLAADTGVSRSDQLAWHAQLSHLETHSKMAVLNKIDTLNDGLRSSLEIQTDVLQQMECCAAALDLPKNQVFAVSARGALLARIAQDSAQLKLSRLPLLEQSLTTQLLENHQRSLKALALQALEQSYRSCARELKGIMVQSKTQLEELGVLTSSQNPEKALSAYASDTKKRYTLEATLSQSIRQTMDAQARRISELLSPSGFQACFDPALSACQNGNAKLIKEQLHAAIVAISMRLEQISQESSKPLQSANHALGKVNKLNGIVDGMGSVTAPQLSETLMFKDVVDELARLSQTSQAQLSSMPMLTSAARSKAMQTVMAIRARCVQLASDADTIAQRWFSSINEPIAHAMKMHQAMLLKRTDTLERMQQAQHALVQNLGVLREEFSAREQQLARMKHRCEQVSWAIAGDARGAQAPTS